MGTGALLPTKTTMRDTASTEFCAAIAAFMDRERPAAELAGNEKPYCRDVVQGVLRNRLVQALAQSIPSNTREIDANTGPVRILGRWGIAGAAPLLLGRPHRIRSLVGHGVPPAYRIGPARAWIFRREDCLPLKHSRPPGNNCILKGVVNRATIPIHNDAIDLSEEGSAEADVLAGVNEIRRELPDVVDPDAGRVLGYPDTHNGSPDMPLHQRHCLLRRLRRCHKDRPVRRPDGDRKGIARSCRGNESLDDSRRHARSGALLD